MKAVHCIQGKAPAAHAATETPVDADGDTVAGLGRHSGLLTGTFGPGDADSTAVAAASMAAANDRVEVQDQGELTASAQSAGSHEAVPATDESVVGPQTAAVPAPAPAAQAIVQAETLEQQAHPASMTTYSMSKHCSFLASCFIHVSFACTL